MDNETLVIIRNQIVDDLVKGIDIFKKTKKKWYITKTLNKIARTKGYTVDTECFDQFYFFGECFKVQHIKIVESYSNFIIRLFVDDFGILQLNYDYYMLQTHEENEFERRQEIEAEREMNMWALGYRTSSIF